VSHRRAVESEPLRWLAEVSADDLLELLEFDTALGSKE